MPRGLSDEMKRQVADMVRSGAYTDGEIAEKLHLSRSSVVRFGAHARPDDRRRYLHAGHPDRGGPPPAAAPSHPRGPTGEPRLPEPSPEAGGPSLPDAVALCYEPFSLDQTPGMWGVLGDVHLPYHDKQTLELFVAECRRRCVAGVLLNGDILDSHELSHHQKDRDALSYVEEIDVGRQFIAWLRSRLPRARVVLKEGNHDDRVQRYIINNAPALSGLEGFNLPALLHLDDHGVEWVSDKRVVNAGKLPIIHGHEYPGGGGVNPARWLYLRARSVAMCNHFHRTSEHHARNIKHQFEAAWSIGCGCFLHPRWMPLNEWNLGFAFTDFDKSGDFMVENKRVLGGKIV